MWEYKRGFDIDALCGVGWFHYSGSGCLGVIAYGVSRSSFGVENTHARVVLGIGFVSTYWASELYRVE